MIGRTKDREDWITADPCEYPAHPYPGQRPHGSWRLTADGRIHRLRPVGGQWTDQHTLEAADVGQRHLILAYGSNLNPAKLAEKFEAEDVLVEEVLVLSATVYDWCAAWCNARRRAGDVVATLVSEPGSVEVHAVMAVTQRQLDVMDKWEGDPKAGVAPPGYYVRQQFAGRCVLESGETPALEVYLGTPEGRPALMRDGRIVRVRDVGYGEVDSLVAPR